MFGGYLEDGGWLGTDLSDGNENALRLGEHEFYERKFYYHDIEAISPDSESKYIELWFQDSLGNRHIVRGSKKGIQLLAQI